MSTADAVTLLAQPLIFEPLFMERVWGGRRLEQIYGKKLPQGAAHRRVLGNSWIGKRRKVSCTTDPCAPDAA